MRANWLRNNSFVFLAALQGCALSMAPLHESTPHLIEMGIEHLHRGFIEEAEASFRLAAEVAPTPEAFDGIACARFFRGDYDGAIDLLKAVVEWFPEYPFSHSNLALIYDILQERALALESYRRALTLSPLDMQTRNNFGAFLAQAGELLEGETYLRDAWILSKHPIVHSNIETLIGRGL